MPWYRWWWYSPELAIAFDDLTTIAFDGMARWNTYYTDEYPTWNLLAITDLPRSLDNLPLNERDTWFKAGPYASPFP